MPGPTAGWLVQQPPNDVADCRADDAADENCQCVVGMTMLRCPEMCIRDRLMAPVMAAAMGLAALSLGMAALAVGGLAIAVVLTVRELSLIHI